MTKHEREVIDIVANALASAVLLSAQARREAGDHADLSVKLEAAVDRAAKALKRLSPEKKS